MSTSQIRETASFTWSTVHRYHAGEGGKIETTRASSLVSFRWTISRVLELLRFSPRVLSFPLIYFPTFPLSPPTHHLRHQKHPPPHPRHARNVKQDRHHEQDKHGDCKNRNKHGQCTKSEHGQCIKSDNTHGQCIKGDNPYHGQCVESDKSPRKGLPLTHRVNLSSRHQARSAHAASR